MTRRRTLNARSLPLLAAAAVLILALTPSGDSGAVGRSSVLAPLADGFDFPVGKPEAQGYYKARGFWPNVHPGEDWNGRGGGNTDLGDPVYAMGDGVVVASDDYRAGWGNCVIIRHAFRDASGRIRMVDSQYAHLNRRHVRTYQVVRRGQQVGTIGTARGRYPAHLHFEVRKNLKIGMNRSQFPRTYDHYFSPTLFIRAHRKLRTSTRRYPIPVNTFAAYGETLPPTQPVRPEGSVVPVRPKPAETPKLDPELAEIIERNKVTPVEQSTDSPDMDSFWSRLRERFKTPGSETPSPSSRPGRP